MRQIDEALAAHLASGVTTLCHGWRITRRDGVLLGFTDHDRDLMLEGLELKAASGIAGSEHATAQGLAVTGAELSGALSHGLLTVDDLAAGLYDGAAVELFLLNWAEPSAHLLLRRGTIGEVRCEEGAFTAEIRASSDALNQTRGRVFAAHCDADLGDMRCGVELAHPAFQAEGVVSRVSDGLRLSVSGVSGFVGGFFARGRAQFLSGANAGFATEVKSHRVEGEGAIITLWQGPPQAVAEGDRLQLRAGCDKRFATCRDRFSNALNFQGFPHMPGNDFVISVAVPGEGGYDGSLLS
ncbi:DUF2163 domain-containing protein [Xanthobacter sp. TB0139]|uniref:DUF2163 domain-containing protein n=1 Tax=Xanthobacter sp. TB0139 TaxID=3459178 RepID=UPI00403A3186